MMYTRPTSGRVVVSRRALPGLVSVAGLAMTACGSVDDPGGRDAVGDAGDPGDAGRDGNLPGGVTMRVGVDYSFARPSPSGLRAAGYTFAVRYVSHGSNDKNLSADEARALIAAGVDVVTNWETGGSDALEGRARGVTDAQEALSEATLAGMPAGRPIYFSVDFDAMAAQQAAIDDYFDGVVSVLGHDRTGAYGGIAPIKWLFDAGKIGFGWQTYAWSDGQWDPRAHLRQVRNSVTVAGGECDIDQARADDFGQWGAPVNDGSARPR